MFKMLGSGLLNNMVLGWSEVQWGSEYPTSLVLEWSKRGWMPNGLVLECRLNTRQPNHLNTRQMFAILFSYALVHYSNG